MHTIHRGLLSRVFTPRQMNALEPKIREFCADSLDPLVGAGRLRLRRRPRRADADAGDRHAARHPRGRTRRRSATASTRACAPRPGQPMEVTPDDFVSGEMFADYIDWRAEHPSDDLMTELLQRRVRGRDRAPTRRLTPRRDPHLRERGRRRRQRDHHPPHRLGGQGAGRAPRPAAASSSRIRRSSRTRSRSCCASSRRRRTWAGTSPRDVELHGQTVPEGSAMLFLVGVGQP